MAAAVAAADAAVAPSEKDDPSGVGRLDDMFEPKGPVSVLMDLAEKEAKVEEDRGADARSPLLQALVQVSYSSLAPSYIAVAGGRTTGVTGRGAHTGLRVFVLSENGAREKLLFRLGVVRTMHRRCALMPTLPENAFCVGLRRKWPASRQSCRAPRLTPGELAPTWTGMTSGCACDDV